MRHISFGTGEKTMIVVPGISIGYVTDDAQAMEDAFSAFIHDYTIHLFDVRDDVPENYTIRDMGEDLAAAIQMLGIDRTYLYGCSMGGAECLYVAGKYPELVEKLVIASSACKAGDMLNTAAGIWNRLASAGKYHELADSIGNLIYSRHVYEADSEALSAMADGFTQDLVKRFIHTVNVMPDMDLTEEAAMIKCPVLVLGSRGDKLLDTEDFYRTAEMTGGEIYLYGTEYSHAVFDEAPDFRNRVKAFFD